MDNSRQAIEILVEAEESLSALMRDALDHHRYEEVSAVAEIAQRFSDFINSLEGKPPGLRKVESPASRRATKKRGDKRTKPARVAPRLAAAQRASYPRFRREDDRLVKIGWSRKGRQEYEHRAPNSVVWAFAEALRNRDKGSAFRMEDLLPLTGETGEELPSYQAYLALAWLRSEGVVTKNGRDGYRADTTRLHEQELRELWDSMPVHGAAGSEEADG